MSGVLKDKFFGIERTIKHPPAETIEDVITFRLQLLVAIGDRAGHQWSERLFNLSLNQWRLLALIKSRNHSRAGEMADLLLIDKSQASRLIKSLLKRGLIRNMPDPNDGRAVSLSLTDEGAALQDRVFEEVMKSNERILSALTRDEVQALDATLNKLLEHTRDLLDRRLDKPLLR